MKLDAFDNIQYLGFDLPKRKLTVYHNGEVIKIQQAIQELQLNDRLESTIEEDAPLSENASFE